MSSHLNEQETKDTVALAPAPDDMNRREFSRKLFAGGVLSSLFLISIPERAEAWLDGNFKNREDLGDAYVETDCLALGGMSLMENLIGYDRAILVDAIVTGQYPIGHVMSMALDDLPDQAAGHLSSSHDTTLKVALRMGQAMGATLPEKIIIVTIESQNVYDFSELLTPFVAASIPKAAEIVRKILADGC